VRRPGVQYDTTINSWHTLPNTGRINASNPCSEYMSIDDSACNLSSLNLMKFRREDGEFDVTAFEHAVDVMFLAQEICVGYSSYPTPEIDRNAKAYRQLGLGYANLGALLMARGFPYDSDDGRAYAAAITALMTGRAYRKSAEIAQRMGPFAGYRPNAAAMIGVIAKHRAAVGNIQHSDSVPDDLLSAAAQAWDDALDKGEVSGYRNAQATVLAPTGTISFMMDCDTTGRRARLLARQVEEARRRRRDHDREQDRADGARQARLRAERGEEVVAFIDERNTIVGAPVREERALPGLRLRDRRPRDPLHGSREDDGRRPAVHLRSDLEDGQPAEEATVEDVSQLLIESWQLGVKAIAIYRDNCKVAQPLSGSADKSLATLPALAPVGPQAQPKRRRVPGGPRRGRPQVQGRRLRGLHPRRPVRGRHPGDIFVDIAKEGTTLAGLMNSFMISSASGSSTACRSRSTSRSSATCASSRAGSRTTPTSASRSRSSTTSSAGWGRSSSPPSSRRRRGS
jgi:ribonucleoside-diphosphate reductase alpha chain